MISVYKDTIKDALYPKKGNLTKHNKFIKVEEPALMSAGEIRELRKFLQLSQSMFAKVFSVSVKTVMAWERGINPPSGSALRLMNILRKYPDILIEVGIIQDFIPS